jgi:hypothetical protein
MNASDFLFQLADASDTMRACAAYNLGVLGGE